MPVAMTCAYTSIFQDHHTIHPNLKNEFTQFTYGTGEEFLEYLAAEDGVRCKTLDKSGFNLLFVIPCHGLMIQEK